MAQNPKFHGLLGRMAETHDKKNADYAEDGNPYSNFEFAAHVAGVTVDQAFLVLIGVKIARLRELTKPGKKPNNESIQDTRLDLAVYSALKASYHETVPEPAALCMYCNGSGRVSFGDAVIPCRCKNPRDAREYDGPVVPI